MGLAFVCVCLLLRQLALHLHYICGTGPADVPHEGGDDEVRADEATLSPGTQKCGQGPANVKYRSWTSSSSRGGSVLGFPQYGSSCLQKDDDYVENCQLL